MKDKGPETDMMEAKEGLIHEGPLLTPAVDILEDGEALLLIVNMPGVKSDKVDIQLLENELTVSGWVTWKEPEAAAIHKEYTSGNYLRKFTLPKEVDQRKIEANMKNGLLRIRLPKAGSVEPRKITVRAG